MTVALGTPHFNPTHSKGIILDSFQCTRNCFEEGRPTTARVKLGLGGIEWCVAAHAMIDALVLALVVLTSASHLGARLPENLELLGSELHAPLIFGRWK